MERRSFIRNSVVVAAGVILSPKIVLTANAADAPKSLFYTDATVLNALTTVTGSMANCLKKGKACADHCKKQISSGHTEFEKCSYSVQAMMIFCDAAGKLAALKSTQIEKILDSCISSLQTCRDACLEHKEHYEHGMHLECKACEEACSNCLDHCKDLKEALNRVVAA